MKNNMLVLPIIVGIIAAGAGFFGGMKYQESKQPAFFRQAGNSQGRMMLQRNGNTGGGNFRPVSGEIIASDEKSITVKLQDGSSKIVFLSDNTQINKADQVTRDELKTGVIVAIFGTEGTDGTVTAQTIQLNPQQMRTGTNGPGATDGAAQ